MTAALPELKRVIGALGSRVAMEERLEHALSRVLGASVIKKGDGSAKMPESVQISDVGKQALKYYNTAREYLRQGDWAGYGIDLEKLENILIQISANTPGKK